MHKVFLFVIMAVTLCGGLSAQESFRAVTPTGDTLMCCIIEGTDEVSVSQYGGAQYGALCIPERVSHEGREYRVTELGLAAFAECATLRMVALPTSVTWIGRGAFAGCTGLAEVRTVKDIDPLIMDIDPLIMKDTAAPQPQLTGIGPAAFAGCFRLREIYIPPRVTSIGYHAFMGCTGLERVFFWGKEFLQELDPQAFDPQHYRTTEFYFWDPDRKPVKVFKKRTGAKHVEAGISAIIEI